MPRIIMTLSLALLTACAPSVSDYPDAAPCPAGAALCDGVCVVTDTHPDHCGACGNVCGEGSNACVAGVCVCDGTETTSKDACDEPTVCDETGYCLVPDLSGAHCDEIEHIPCADPGKVCVEGYCTTPDCDHPEACNGRDDNCDGLIDRIDPVTPLTRTCYGGPPGTAGVGICRAGEELCVPGAGWGPCQGEQLPGSEDGLLSCDGLDGDCNGCVDDRYDENGNLVCGMPDPVETDVVFIVDVSGSMSDDITAVTASMNGLVTAYSPATWIRWALVRVAYPPPELMEVVQPLGDFSAFLGSLSGLGLLGAIEPTYDAVSAAARNTFTDPALGASATARKIIVVFGDEAAQTQTGLTEDAVCQDVADADATLVVFTEPFYYEDWDACALIYPLSNDAATMTDQLEELFEEVCAAPMSTSEMQEWNRERLAPIKNQRQLDLDLGLWSPPSD